MDTKELKFSKMEYDTTRAKILFKEHPQFYGANFENTKDFVEDSVGNRIRVSGSRKTSDLHAAAEVAQKLWRLSELVEEAAELFCQLEYSIKRVQPDELKAFDLKLIMQNLIYCASRTFSNTYTSTFPPIFMRDDSPLVLLALVAQQASTTGCVEIISEKQNAVVCWLFADLCRKAGFKEDEVALGFVKESDASNVNFTSLDIKEVCSGCVAVVTAKSDLDSAVDALVATPDRDPWRVKRILVQESVVRKFRTSLEDKTRRKSGAKVEEVLLRLCAGGCRYDEKTFLFDFVGGETELHKKPGIILVEAYRTVKELLALLNCLKPYALSVWSDAVAESTEISHHAPSPVIWINSYGNFDGPPEASQAFFSMIEASTARPYVVDIVEPSNLLQVWKSWSNLATSERAAKLKKLDKYDNVGDDGSFYYVSNSFVCAGTEEPVLFTVIPNNTLNSNQYNISKLLTFVVKGGCIGLYRDQEYPQAIADLVNTLRSVDAPVGWVRDAAGVAASSRRVEAVRDFVCRRKVVWTSYGTIFSN